MNTLQKNRSVSLKAVVLCSVIFFYFLLVSFAEAAGQYIPIVAIPGLNDQNVASLPDYINKIYFFTITIGALYGVVKIAFAGVKYSMNDIITNKESAKEDIKGVLLGLAILLIPFIVLRTINPELTRLDVLGSVQTKINLVSGSANTGGGNGGDGGAAATTPLFDSSYPAGTAITSCNGTVSYPNRTEGTSGIGGDDGDAVIDMSKCQTSCTEKNGRYVQQRDSSSSCVYDAKTVESGKRFSDTTCQPGEVLKTAGMFYTTYYCDKIPTN